MGRTVFNEEVLDRSGTNLMSCMFMSGLVLVGLRSVLLLKSLANPKALHETRPVLQHAFLFLHPRLFLCFLLSLPIGLPSSKE